MRSLSFTAIIAALVAVITSLKQDHAEALFQATMLTVTIIICTLLTRIEANLKKRRLKRIRENNAIRRAMRTYRRRYVEVEIEAVAN